jgi:hypothetical protein
VELLGVQEFQEQRLALKAGLGLGTQYDRPTGLRAEAMTRKDLGLSISHSKQVTVFLSARYRVGPLKRPGVEE